MYVHTCTRHETETSPHPPALCPIAFHRDRRYIKAAAQRLSRPERREDAIVKAEKVLRGAKKRSCRAREIGDRGRREERTGRL